MYISRKGKLRKFFITKDPLQKVLKGMLNTEEKDSFHHKRINFMRGMDKQWKVEKESIKSNTVNQKSPDTNNV